MGFKVGKKKVYNIMKKLGLLCKKKKKWLSTTDSNHANPVFPNIAPKLKVTGTNQLWFGDINFVPIGSKKFAYVATLMDVYSRKVIGWDVSMNIDTQLCLSVLKMALNTRKGESLDDLVHHTDRGVQYSSKEYREALADHNIVGSMSRKGNPYDNSFAESLFKTLKNEWLDRHEPESYSDVWRMVNVFFKKYNRERMDSSIGYQQPDEV